MKCLPSSVVKPIAVALHDAKTFRQVRRLVVRQMHNVIIGMMEGDHAQPLYSAQDHTFTRTDSEDGEEDKEKKQKKQADEAEQERLRKLEEEQTKAKWDKLSANTKVPL